MTSLTIDKIDNIVRLTGRVRSSAGEEHRDRGCGRGDARGRALGGGARVGPVRARGRGLRHLVTAGSCAGCAQRNVCFQTGVCVFFEVRLQQPRTARQFLASSSARWW